MHTYITRTTTRITTVATIIETRNHRKQLMDHVESNNNENNTNANQLK